MSFSTPQKSDEGRKQWKPLGLSPPMNDREEADRDNVEGAMTKNGYRHLVVAKDGEVSVESRMVYFLFGRNIPIDAIGDILKNTKAKDRLKHVLDTSGSDTVLNDDDSIDRWKLCQKAIMRLKGLPSSHLIYNEESVPLTNHFQQAKNCYIVAPATTLSLKISLCSGKHPGLAIDGNNLVRNFLDSNEFVERVLDNKGGNSRKILDRLTTGYDTDTLKIVSGNAKKWKYLVDCLSEDGPGLISSFRTDDSFRKKSLSLVEDGEVIKLPRFDRVHGKDGLEDKWDHLELKTAHGMTADTENNKVNGISQLIAQSRQINQGTEPADSQPEVVKLSSSSNSDALSSEDTFDRDNDDHMDVDDDEGAREGRHAMVLVGHVKLDEKHWFLVQNSWKALPLFLASASVLEHRMAGSNITFILGNVTELPNRVRAAQSRVVESENDWNDDGEYEEEDDGIYEEDYQQE